MANEEYVPRPGGRFVSFADQPGGPPAAPYTWPQDTLRVPHGFGNMPLVNDLNANRSKREFWGASTQFLGVNPGTQLVQNVQLDKDGDFWCSGIAVQAIWTAAPSVNERVVTGIPGFLGIADLVTGYSLTPEYYDAGGVLIQGAPWSAFEVRPNFVTAGIPVAWIYPFGAGTRTDMIQPYCFLRGGAVRIGLTVPATPLVNQRPLNMYVSLVGWKEYAYAAA